MSRSHACKDAKDPRRGSALTVFLAFLKLGFASFGGPIAHFGYFREEFVSPRRWLNDQAYVDLVALCQFPPGPSSSQAGIAIGAHRAGLLGGFAAWSAFTLPSGIQRRRHKEVAAAFRGINTVVLGILLAALYDPIFTNTVRSRGDFALVTAALALLLYWKLSPLWVVLFAATGGTVLALAT